MAGAPVKYKIGVIGDSGIGKTSLISRFVENSYPEVYITTQGLTDNYLMHGSHFALSIFDLRICQKIDHRIKIYHQSLEIFRT